MSYLTKGQKRKSRRKRGRARSLKYKILIDALHRFIEEASKFGESLDGIDLPATLPYPEAFENSLKGVFELALSDRYPHEIVSEVRSSLAINLASLPNVRTSKDEITLDSIRRIPVNQDLPEKVLFIQ